MDRGTAGKRHPGTAALDRFCLALGATAGNIALAQGSTAVLIAGDVGLRIAKHLPRSGFRSRFIAKGRFERRMDDMPVKLITYPSWSFQQLKNKVRSFLAGLHFLPGRDFWPLTRC